MLQSQRAQPQMNAQWIQERMKLVNYVLRSTGANEYSALR